MHSGFVRATILVNRGHSKVPANGGPGVRRGAAAKLFRSGACERTVMAGEAQRLLLLLILQAQLQHVLNAAVGAQSLGQCPPVGAMLLLILQAQLQHVLNAAVGAQSLGQCPPVGASASSRDASQLFSRFRMPRQERNPYRGYLASLSNCSITAATIRSSP